MPHSANRIRIRSLARATGLAINRTRFPELSRRVSGEVLDNPAPETLVDQIVSPLPLMIRKFPSWARVKTGKEEEEFPGEKNPRANLPPAETKVWF
nr:hypothetical protein Iba_scaffold2431CG0910 [Ipomoea batatas]